MTGQNLYVRDVLQDLYLWNEFLPSVNPTSFASPEDYLEAVRYRPLDSRFSYITSAAASNAFYSDSQFIGYGFSTSLQGDELRVLQVYPDSPASEAGLARGDAILEDGWPLGRRSSVDSGPDRLGVRRRARSASRRRSCFARWPASSGASG